MSLTKHKIFKVKISDDGKFSINTATDKAINGFLAEPNNVYINHSITTITEDVEEYGEQKTICRLLIISLIYKDISATELNVKNTSKRVKEIVHKEFETGSQIDEPNIETAMDKEIEEFSKKKPDFFINLLEGRKLNT